MTEPKKQEVSILQSKAGLSIVESAKVADLVYTAAEDTIVVESTVIHRSENGLFSLTDLHKAAGSPVSKEPYAFLRSRKAKDTIEVLQEQGIENVHETIVGGANQGTYANEILAYEYATYLDKRYKVKALVILNVATQHQTGQVQQVHRQVVAAVGEDAASKLDTVAKLAEALKEIKSLEQDLDFANKIIEDERSKANAAKKAIAMQRNPHASMRKDSAEYKAEAAAHELRTALGEVKDCMEILGLADNALERVRRGIPNDNKNLHEELKVARNRLATVIERLLNL